MKKGEIYEGTVERIEFPNKGVVMIDGEKAIVKNALPGQKIRFRINKKRGGRCEGMLLEVVEHSKLETAEDVCPHFGICGGCLYQPIPYEEQLAIKEKQVRSLLDAVCPEYEFEGILGSPLVQGYRNKMEFSFGDEVKDGPMSLGMHKRGSFYDVVTTGECHIVHPDFCKILVCTKEYFEEKKVGFYKKMQHTGYLRHLLVRRAIKTGEILVDLITTTQTDTFEGTEEALLRGWTERLQALPMEGSFAGILHTKNDTLADAVKDEGTDILFGREHFYEELLGLRFQISPFSFFQTNSLGAEVLYETYAKTINIEALTMVDMANKQIIPAVMKYSKSLADAVIAITEAGGDTYVPTRMLQQITQKLTEMEKASEALLEVEKKASAMERGKEQAFCYHDEVMVAMNALRKPADELEKLVDKKYWPFPTYADLLFEV